MYFSVYFSIDHSNPGFRFQNSKNPNFGKNSKFSEKSEKITEILKRQKTSGARRTSPCEAHSPLTRAPRGLGWAAPRGGEPTSRTASRRLFAYKLPPDLKLTDYQASTHEKFRSSAAIADKIWGTKVSIPHAVGTGNGPRSHLHRLHHHLHRRC